MTDLDVLNVSTDSELFLHLHSRKVPKAETDPDKRCAVVSGWPNRPATKNTEKYCELSAGPPADAVCRDVPPSLPLSMPLSMPTAPPSRYTADDYVRRIRDLEDLIDRERQEVGNHIRNMQNWKLLEEKQKMIGALERTVNRMKQEQERKASEQTCGQAEVGAPVLTSIPKHSDADDAPGVSTSKLQKKAGGGNGRCPIGIV